jgi:predicted ATP-grasp superfamily ATP-dependent carboligase
MENILVVGANTRPIACSLKNIGFNVYSADYFGCMDLKNCVTGFKSILSQKPHTSCGHFSKKFDSELIIEMASEMVDNSDYIIYNSGISPVKFPKKKLLGNINISSIENKYKLYLQLVKRFEGVFKLPQTYLVNDLQDATEIAKANVSKKFLLKPLEGSGGVGIENIEDIDPDVDIHQVILQEIVEGDDVSASVLSSGDEAKTILTSGQLIGNMWLGQRERYGYCGNILPHIKKPNIKNRVNRKHFETVAEDIVHELKLIGSNGVDMIIKNGEIYVIEVNPRLQGTFEAAEASLNINMALAHIMACQGELIDIAPPKKFAAKMIVFAKMRSKVGNLNIKGVNDIPAQNVIIEKGEPVATVLTSGRILENTVYSAKRIVSEVYENLKPSYS